ncbi:hypothetical protein NP233_g174 [Leucocoprinus birnbaumii]|uniref:Aminoglycoside phosphotransferase domain-containing protein n=1 Tax=Leucocoprinus birnbaumii TaxID=56174 RepID=A0AAD5YWX9_9AGAR|nr:hypothetical protein NP233_g174 [Leucocoprinus birnbaumii]
MHRCLQIPELFQIVSENLRGKGFPFEDREGRSCLAVLARACRGWTSAALDSLWFEIHSLAPLIQTMPRDLWLVQNNTLSLQRPLTSSDLQVLEKYSPRVRHFITRSSPQLETRVNREIYQALIVVSPRGLPLLPNLRCFAPKINHLELKVNMTSAEQLSLVPALPTYCPDVQRLIIAFWPSYSLFEPEIYRGISDTLSRWKGLRFLDLFSVLRLEEIWVDVDLEVEDSVVPLVEFVQAVARHCDKTTLRGFHLRYQLRVNLVVPFSIFSPLLDFHPLEWVELATSPAVTMMDEDATRMASSWPKIDHLQLSPFCKYFADDDLLPPEPTTTLSVLLPIAKGCPKLNFLAIELDVLNSEARLILLKNPDMLKGIKHLSLRKLSVGTSLLLERHEVWWRIDKELIPLICQGKYPISTIEDLEAIAQEKEEVNEGSAAEEDDESSVSSLLLNIMDSDGPWDGVSINLDALQDIVGQVFRLPSTQCGSPIPIGLENGGRYARVYSFQLPSRIVVARLVSPIKPLFKTEGEVAAMDFVRNRTSLPVPKIFAYCSEATNPVGVEWIVMEHMPGVEMYTAWPDLQLSQKRKLALDLIHLYDELYRLKADGCGSIYHRIDSVDDRELFINSNSTIKHSRSRRWVPLSPESLRMLKGHFSRSVQNTYILGPINDIAILNYREAVPPPSQTLPVFSSEDYVKLLAFNGDPPTRDYYDLPTREKCVELFQNIYTLYPNSTAFGPYADLTNFRFSHGDLHDENILVDPHTGSITGIIDWEGAGFRPLWTDVCGVGWFDEDRQRFLFGSQDPANFEEDASIGDNELRAFFRTEMYKRNPDLFACFFGGVELRAVLHAAQDDPRPYGKTNIFLDKYHELGFWKEERRGPFPWDMLAWQHRRIDLDIEEMVRSLVNFDLGSSSDYLP